MRIRSLLALPALLALGACGSMHDVASLQSVPPDPAWMRHVGISASDPKTEAAATGIVKAFFHDEVTVVKKGAQFTITITGSNGKLYAESEFVDAKEHRAKELYGRKLNGSSLKMPCMKSCPEHGALQPYSTESDFVSFINEALKKGNDAHPA